MICCRLVASSFSCLVNHSLSSRSILSVYGIDVGSVFRWTESNVVLSYDLDVCLVKDDVVVCAFWALISREPILVFDASDAIFEKFSRGSHLLDCCGLYFLVARNSALPEP